MSTPQPGADFDEEALSELQEDMEDAMPAFVFGFLANVDTSRAKMREASSSADFDDVGQVAHALKGTAGYLGATAMVSVLQDIQVHCRDGANAEVLGEMLDNLDSISVLVRQRLEPLASDEK